MPDATLKFGYRQRGPARGGGYSVARSTANSRSTSRSSL